MCKIFVRDLQSSNTTISGWTALITWETSVCDSLEKCAVPIRKTLAPLLVVNNVHVSGSSKLSQSTFRPTGSSSISSSISSSLSSSVSSSSSSSSCSLTEDSLVLSFSGLKENSWNQNRIGKISTKVKSNKQIFFVKLDCDPSFKRKIANCKTLTLTKFDVW